MILADQLPLGINVGNLIAQVVTFIILLIVLGKYVFPLLFKIMSKIDKEATCTRV